MIRNISNDWPDGFFYTFQTRLISEAVVNGATLTGFIEETSPSGSRICTSFDLPFTPQVVYAGEVFSLGIRQEMVIPDHVYENHKSQLDKYEYFNILKIEKLSIMPKNKIIPTPQEEIVISS
jgi:hypothetical protein